MDTTALEAQGLADWLNADDDPNATISFNHLGRIRHQSAQPVIAEPHFSPSDDGLQHPRVPVHAAPGLWLMSYLAPTRYDSSLVSLMTMRATLPILYRRPVDTSVSGFRARKAAIRCSLQPGYGSPTFLTTVFWM